MRSQGENSKGLRMMALFSTLKYNSGFEYYVIFQVVEKEVV